MRMTRAIAGGDVPSKENKPLDIKIYLVVEAVKMPI